MKTTREQDPSPAPSAAAAAARAFSEWGPNGLVGATIFWRSELLASARALLASLGYREVLLDLARTRDEPGALHDRIRVAFGLVESADPAWNDLRSAFGAAGHIAPTERVAIVVANAHAARTDDLHRLVDAVLAADREFLAHGGRISVLLHTVDEWLEVGPVAPIEVRWNAAERLRSARGGVDPRPFVELALVDGRVIRQLLATYDRAALLTALVGAPDMVLENLGDNLSVRAAVMLREDVEVTRADAPAVAEARLELMREVARLEEEACADR